MTVCSFCFSDFFMYLESYISISMFKYVLDTIVRHVCQNNKELEQRSHSGLEDKTWKR